MAFLAIGAARVHSQHHRHGHRQRYGYGDCNLALPTEIAGAPLLITTTPDQVQTTSAPNARAAALAFGPFVVRVLASSGPARNWT